MKRFISILLAGLMLSAIVSLMPVGASAESLYIRKVVSVVYDDSGSMAGEKTAYANYAMQAFCGMLNSEDRLFITYMSRAQRSSQYTPEEIDLSSGGIKKSVENIRNHSGSGSTPFSSVETAYKKLAGTADSNPNTQYWLVVITDGAFDEFSFALTAKKFLNEKFNGYVESVMPNGSNPQVTFLGIGEVVAPDENHRKGIYTYSASNAGGIVDAMSQMADRISGRTRLESKNIKKINENTVSISSSIPLLNIAVLAQGSDARISQAAYSNDAGIPVSRDVSLGYPGYRGLVGSACLLGDSKTVIGAGTYNITFDKSVSVDDVVILFEPALEARVTVTLNGKTLSDPGMLSGAMEGDRVSVSCRIFEMGTDREIDPSIMPPGTKFEISVSEDGRQVKQVTDKNMSLSDYVLKNVETDIRAAVMIEGFNPIDYSVRFTPAKYVPKVVYSITASAGSGGKSVKYDNIAGNRDVTVCFTVYADGKAVTDPEEVRALCPVIDVSPQGNSGSVAYSDDGVIVFTPNAAQVPSGDIDSFDVNVTCTLADGTSASGGYTVLIASYEVIAADGKGSVKKTGLADNKTSVTFYITKDGIKLDRAAVENRISVLLNREHAGLKVRTTVSPDGTVTVLPYSDEEYALTFATWWTNWFRYFRLSGKDIEVTLDHAFGSGTATIDVTEEDITYIILDVLLPLAIEVTALVLLITWILLVIFKPRYGKNAALYVGMIRYNPQRMTHTLRDFRPVRLKKFNRIKKGNGRLKFKRKADTVSAGGIKIRAEQGGAISCEMGFPWYKGRVKPDDTSLSDLREPSELAEYMSRNGGRLEIEEFVTTETIEGDYSRKQLPFVSGYAEYTVVPDAGGVTTVDGRNVIKSGRIFIYSTIHK